jgi:hypothetical protein
VDTENSKGLAVGYSATFSSTFLNNLRYGFIRPGLGSSGNSKQHFVHLGRQPFWREELVG